MVLLLISVLIVTAHTGVITVQRTSSMDYSASRVSYAAEAGADAIMAQLADAMQDGALTDEEIDAVTAPEMEGFTFSELEVTRVGMSEVETITDGPFTGLYSLTQKLEIKSEATDPFENASTVVITAKAQAIPIFQFGIFFDQDLEITNGPRLDFDGWVHSNGKVYVSSNNAYYKDIVSTAKEFIHNRKDQDLVRDGVYIDDAGGNEVNVDFDSRSLSNHADFRAASQSYFDGRLKTAAHGVDSLRVPLPPGMAPVAVTQPRSGGDNALVRKAKFAWKADWYITVPLDLLLPDGSNLCAVMTSTRDGGEPLPTLGECANIFTMRPERFYEGHELRWIDIFDVDLAQLFAWTTANPGGQTSILYVNFTGAGAALDLQGDGTFPVVRVYNGQNLGNAFTVATDRPIYVWGDYNTVGWVPASVVGDAITLLSNAWNDLDGEHQDSDPGTNYEVDATNTSYYTAILAGHLATPWDWFDGGGDAPYGGGVENYPRFLEDWSGGVVCTYFGSLVSLHTSVFANSTWNGSYYTPPTRDWWFDMRFEDPTNLPPGTPVVGSVIHTAFRPVY